MDKDIQIITGERIQELCDVYCGMPDDFNYNPRISTQSNKLININSITTTWDNPRIIFCYSHRLPEFRMILKHLQNKVILVSHNSDENITHNYHEIANHPIIEKWYAQNLLYNHDKLELLPIGIANSMWGHGNLSQITHLIKNPVLTKTNDFYFYFSVFTNFADRRICKDILEKKGLIFGSPIDFSSYNHQLSNFKYAICPPGNGVDCHRIWECIYLNVIPILFRSVFAEKCAEIFPNIIILDMWDDFDAAKLLNTYSYPSFTDNDRLDLNNLNLRLRQ
jgi:hypothetical protein